jgi:Protein ChrB, N-terminal
MSDWLIISYRVPNQPSALRVATWRALKQRGAVLLGPGLYALPDTETHRQALADLSARISDGGGAAIALTAAALTADDARALELKLGAARHDEYRQVVKSAQKLIDHIGREEESRDYRFAEVESLEEELDKVRRQLQRVLERDAADELPTQRAEAAAALSAAEDRLHQYLDRAYREENHE